MEPWYITLLKLIIWIPLKLIELILNIFAFIVYVIASPFVKIVSIIKGDNNKTNTTKDDKS